MTLPDKLARSSTLPSTRWRVAAATAALALVATFAAALPARAQDLKPATLVKGLQNPWGMAFLPSFQTDGRMLVTERSGALRIVNTKSGEVGPPIEGVPQVDARGQGGLLDVALDPKFADNSLVYISYSQAGQGGNSTAVARGKLEVGAAGSAPKLTNVQVIFVQRPKFASTAHFGSRLVFARDGKLFVTLGDRFLRRDDAQILDNLHGKIVRLEADGKVPADNPFVGKAGAAPEIYTYGHRNVQGAALHPDTGVLWTQEHGPQGGDEVNIESPGKNYGWPVITYGAEYGSGAKIGEGFTKEGVEPPITKWVPSIAPSGMAFLTSDRYPGWKGNLFIGALKAQMLVRLELDGNKVVKENRLLESFGERIRDVRQGPDGWLYVLTDSRDGSVARLDR
ncbi:PQQ-dependent sugar dehydrogenase [soil metagenome]